MEKLLLKVPEAAGYAGVSRTVAYNLIASGEWPKVQVGRAIHVPVHALETWVEEKTVWPNRPTERDDSHGVGISPVR